jgi:hypothetical protein
MTDEEKAKAYNNQRDAESMCDDAYHLFQRYMRKIGLAARSSLLVAMNQIERDFDYIANDHVAECLLDKAIEASKRDEDGMPIPYASGHSSDEEGESCYAWAVFLLKDLPKDIDLNFDAQAVAYNLTGWQQHYRGPGQSFSSEPYIGGKSNTRILVKQFRGLDI